MASSLLTSSPIVVYSSSSTSSSSSSSTATTASLRVPSQPSTGTSVPNLLSSSSSASASIPGIFPAGSLIFRSDFDSGRLGAVRYEGSTGGENVYNLWLPADGEENMERYARHTQSTTTTTGTNETLLSPSPPSSSSYPSAANNQPPLINDEYRVWYLFAITNGVPGTTIRLRIMNMNVIAKVYNSDLRPLVRVPTLSPTWERVNQPTSFTITGGNLELQITWEYTFVSSSPVYFAFYYPFSYTDCQRLLDNVDRVMINLSTNGTALLGSQTVIVPAPLFTATGSAPAPKKMIIQNHPNKTTSIVLADDNIYYHRELLCYSPDGRRVELLTISSCHGITNERELPFDDSASSSSFPIPTNATLRPHKFKGKPGVFISARVHPGETASSYMLHGFLAFLLQPRNPHAKALRTSFVFKIVPMINPDGVARGYFRTDQYGINLNRAYASPSLTYQPAIAGIKMVLRQMAATLSPVTLPQEGRTLRALHNSQNGLYIYIDLHGFTGRDGCYIIGNALPSHKEARCRTFTYLLQLYAPQFNAFACTFGSAHARKKANRADPSFNVSSTINTGNGTNQRENLLENLRRKLKIDPGITSGSTSAGTNGNPNILLQTLLTTAGGDKGKGVGVGTTKYVRQRIQPVDVTSLAYAVSILTGNENNRSTDVRSSTVTNTTDSNTLKNSFTASLETGPGTNVPETAIVDQVSNGNGYNTGDMLRNKMADDDNNDDKSTHSYRDEIEDDDNDTDADSLDGDVDNDDDEEDEDEEGNSSDDDSSTGRFRKKNAWILPPGTVRWSKTMNKEKLLAAQIQSLQYFNFPVPSLVPPTPTPSLSSIILGRMNNTGTGSLSKPVNSNIATDKNLIASSVPTVVTLNATASYGLPLPPPVPKYDIPSRVDASKNAKKEIVIGIAPDGTRYAVASSAINKGSANVSPSKGTVVSTSPNRNFLNLSAVRSISPIISPSASPPKTLSPLPGLLNDSLGPPKLVDSTLPLSRKGIAISVLPIYSNLLGASNKVPSYIRILDPTISYPPILPEGSRWGPAYSLLHELEARKVQKEWNAMKSRPVGSRMNPSSSNSGSNFPNIFFPSASTTNTFTHSDEGLLNTALNGQSNHPRHASSPVVGVLPHTTSLASSSPLLISTASYVSHSPPNLSAVPSVNTNDIGRENKKGGTGRARVYREFGVIHSYTVECSCNLLSHANVLHRSLLFSNSSNNAPSSMYTKNHLALASKTGSLPYLQNNRLASSLGLSTSNTSNRVSVDINKYTVAHTKVFAGTSESIINGGGLSTTTTAIPYSLIDCPMHSLPYRSQVDARYTSPSVNGSKAETNKMDESSISSSSVSSEPVASFLSLFLCQIDSLQPPASTSSSSSTNKSSNETNNGTNPTNAASASSSSPPNKDVLNVSQLNFHSPFGLSSSLPLPYDTCTCTWGTCPNDPPSVFAMVGRALGYTIVDFIGITQSKENLGSSLQQHHAVFTNVSTHRPLNPSTLIASRLTSTVFRSMNGLHKFSRVISGAEQLSRDELWKLYSSYYQLGWTSILSPSVLGGNTGTSAMNGNTSTNNTTVSLNTNSSSANGINSTNPLMNGKGGFAAISAALASRAQSFAAASTSVSSGTPSLLSDSSTTVATIINSEPDLILGSLLLNDRPQTIDSIVYPLPLQTCSVPYIPYQKYTYSLMDSIPQKVIALNKLHNVPVSSSTTVSPSKVGTIAIAESNVKILSTTNTDKEEKSPGSNLDKTIPSSLPRPDSLTRSLSSNDQYTTNVSSSDNSINITIPSLSSASSSSSSSSSSPFLASGGTVRPPSSSHRNGKISKTLLRPKSASLYPPDFPTSPLVVLAPTTTTVERSNTGIPSPLVINNQRQTVQLPSSQWYKYSNHFNPSTRTSLSHSSPRSTNG